MRCFAPLALSALLLSTAGCPGGLPSKPDVPDVPGGGSGGLDPSACGSYASTDIGKKVKAFLEATMALDKAVKESQDYVLETCKLMGAELGMSDLDGDTQKVCSAVAAELKASIQAGVKAEASLEIEYKPAVCTIDASAQARAEAQCGGSATAGTGGNAADGACQSSAMVEASLVAKCEPAEVNVSGGADIALDTAKMEAAIKAMKVGLPRLALVHAKMTGPIAKASVEWAASAKALSKAGRDLLSDVGDQVMCVSGQIAAAANMVSRITGSIEIQVEVSVEVSGSAGASL